MKQRNYILTIIALSAIIVILLILLATTKVKIIERDVIYQGTVKKEYKRYINYHHYNDSISSIDTTYVKIK